MSIETVDIHISPELTNAAAAQHESLVSVLRYNDELRRQVGNLRRLNDISADRTELITKFLAGVRAIAEFMELPWRVTDADQQEAQALRRKAQELHTDAHQMLNTYVPLQVAFEDHWNELEDAVREAEALIDMNVPEGNGSISLAPQMKTFFGLEGPQAQSVQVQVKQALAQNLVALQEEVVKTSGAQRMVDRSSRALSRWRELQVDAANDAIELLLAFGNFVSSAAGNMPDLGDSMALGLLRLETYVAMAMSRTGRQQAFESLVRDLALAGSVDADELRGLLAVTSDTTGAQQRRSFTDATALLEPKFQTGFRLSLLMSGLSALQLLSALSACQDPSEAEIRDWINLGMSATYTGLDLIVTIERGMQLRVSRAAMGLASARTGASWLPAVSQRAALIGAAIGVVMGYCDFLDGVHEGSTLRATGGIVNIISGLAFTVSAGAEIVASGAAAGSALAATATTTAAVFSGIGIVFAAAGLLIGVILDSMERAENLREAPSAALALIMAAVLGDEAQTHAALVAPRSRPLSAEERRQEERWQQWSQVFSSEEYGNRGPEPPRPRTRDPLIAILDRGANTSFETKLREMYNMLVGETNQRILGGSDTDYDIELRTIVVPSTSQREEILTRLHSLGIQRQHAMTARMVRVG